MKDTDRTKASHIEIQLDQIATNQLAIIAKLNRIENRQQMIPDRLDQLLARKKRVVKAKGSKDAYPVWFEELWKNYPKRAGGNPKNKAYSACNARFAQDYDLGGHDLLAGVKRYAKFCDATGKTGTEYVMQAATFFGPDKHYLNDWTIPNKRESLPRNDSDLEAFAVKKGLHPPGQAPRNIVNMGQYRAWIQEHL